MKNNFNPIFLACLFFICQSTKLTAQEIPQADFYKSTSGYNYRLNIRTYFLINGGITFSAGFSNWISYQQFQPAENLSVNFLLCKRNLGNRDKDYNRWQVNVISSTFLTFNVNNKRNELYDELNPFYYGNCSAVYTNYRNAISLGSSFVAMPKGKGFNVSTPRNRSQQLLYLQLKSSDVLINVYEDYLIVTDWGPLQCLADNRDRYYTGGGNLQVRLNKNMKVKYYSEMYTGNSYMDRDDYPDWLIPKGSNSKFKQRPFGIVGPGRALKFAYQDDGQKEFNRGRNLLMLEINANSLTSKNTSFNSPSYSDTHLDIILGHQDAQWDMMQQQLIHSLNSIDRNIKNKENKVDRLHFFEPQQNYEKKRQKIVFGFGSSSEFVAQKQ